MRTGSWTGSSGTGYWDCPRATDAGWAMGSLTVTYARGRFLLGAKEISIEIDGILYGTIVGGGSRTFEMPDGEHLVVLRYSHVTTRVELHLSGEESFTVSWDRTMGGMRITEEFEGDVFLDRRAWKYLAAYSIMAGFIAALVGLETGGHIPRGCVLAGTAAVLTISCLILVHIHRRMSKTVVWGREEDRAPDMDART